jgi:hypothetical protein
MTPALFPLLRSFLAERLADDRALASKVRGAVLRQDLRSGFLTACRVNRRSENV